MDPQYASTFEDRYILSAQLAVHRQEKIGHSWQEASFVIVYLFCVQPPRYKCLFDSSLKTNGAQTGGREGKGKNRCHYPRCSGYAQVFHHFFKRRRLLRLLLVM